MPRQREMSRGFAIRLYADADADTRCHAVTMLYIMNTIEQTLPQDVTRAPPMPRYMLVTPRTKI